MVAMPYARILFAAPRFSGRLRHAVGSRGGACWATRLLLAMLLFATSPARGQKVEGTVVDRASRLPFPGVTIVLLDSGNTPVTSALSDERGRFLVAASLPGLYRLRFEAVGMFSETSPELLRLEEGETLNRTIAFEQRVRDLPAVTVTAKSRCVTAPEAGAAVAVLWDEVRKALAVTQLTAEAQRYRFDLVQYERELDPKSKAVRRSRSWERVGITDQPYASIPADSLTSHGYVQTTRDGTWYYAPDARTLLSDDFVRTHCLRPMAAKDDRSGLVGLAFEPTEERKIPDVSGVLWLETSTSRLRFLEYHYTGLPKGIRDHGFGGRVEFERLPTGAWVVQRWHITMPRISRQVRSMPSGLPEVGPPRLVPVTVDVVIGIIEKGGEVKTRVPSGIAVVTTQLGSIEGSVFDSTGNGPLAQASIWLEAPGEALPARRIMTDSAGTFRMDSVPTGRYTLTLTHPRLDALGATFQPVPLNVEGGQLTLSMATPSVPKIVNSMCPGGVKEDAAVVRGAVLRADSGARVPGARVVARWGDSSSPGSGPHAPSQEHSATADEGGHFTFCGLPRDRALELRAVEAGSRGEPLMLTLASERLAMVELLAPNGRSEIAGVVSGPDGKPIEGAEIRVLDSELAIRTDARGRYRVAALPAGKHVVEARALGYAPARQFIDLADGVSDTVDLTLRRVAQPLKAVTTVGSRDRYRTGFQSRMARNAGGRFLTSDQIRRSGYIRVTELLATVPGLQIRKSGNVSVMEFTGRGGRTFSSHGCPVAYALDGVPLELTSFGLDGELGVEDIEAIEVYDAATAPAQFSRRGTGCGVILIWTRESTLRQQPKDVDDEPDDVQQDSSRVRMPEGQKRKP